MEQIKKIIKNPFFISFLLIISILIYVICSILTKPNQFNTLLNYVKEINKITTVELIKTSLTSDELITIHEDNKKNLNTVKNSLIALELEKDLHKTNSLLINTIEAHIKLVDSIIFCLENIESENLIQNNNKVLENKTSLTDIYLEANKNKLPLALSDNHNTAMNITYKYINEIIKLNRDFALTTTNNNTFKTSLDLIYTNFTPLTENIFSVINLVQNDGRDLSAVLNTINDNIALYKNLNIELHSLAIPSGYNEVFTSLQDIFKTYDTYITELRNYVISEISENTDNESLKTAKKEYTKLNELTSKYLELFSEIN